MSVAFLLIERKLARVPAPRVFPKEPKSLLQANITIDHRSQITEEKKRKSPEKEPKKEHNPACNKRVKEKKRKKQGLMKREKEARRNRQAAYA